jgi:hypothetical protein
MRECVIRNENDFFCKVLTTKFSLYCPQCQRHNKLAAASDHTVSSTSLAYNTRNSVHSHRANNMHFVLTCLPLDRRFAGSNPAQNDGFLGEIKIRNTTSFVGEVKPLAPCRNILRHVKKLRSMTEMLRRLNSKIFLAKFLTNSLLGVSAATREVCWMNHEWLELRWGRTKDQKMVAVHGMLSTIPPRNSNRKRRRKGSHTSYKKWATIGTMFLAHWRRTREAPYMNTTRKQGTAMSTSFKPD